MRAFSFVAALLSFGLIGAGANAQEVSLPPDTVINSKETPGSFSELSRRLMPAVVNISTSQTIAEVGLPNFPNDSPLERFNDFFGRSDDGFRRQGALGSGFVISSDGYIVTNNHVIENADEITIEFEENDPLIAELIGRDPNTDLAVLKVDSPTPLKYVRFADSDEAEVGDWVIAIGNPLGFGGSVSAGIISARNRDINQGSYDDFIQTDAAINQGNSGGPLFNLRGEVVGVNTAIISPSGGSIGIGFSIPANLAKRVSSQLREYGEPRRSWLGVNIQPVDKDLATAYGLEKAEGVIVTSVTEDGPAEKAGVEVGDLLLKFDGKSIEDTRSLTRRVADAGIGKTVAMDIIRERRRTTLNVELGELENNIEEKEEVEVPDSVLSDNPLGVQLGRIDDVARRKYGIASDIVGALIQHVPTNSPSQGKLRKGDVIVEMDFEPVPTVAAAVAKMESGKSPMLVRVHRGGRDAFYSIELQ